ncbi:MAG TPA: efflux RND transporter periplasmic adaptor subunit [Candidatus Paceibacterota bacterium]|nr:efflux RND transporter periplasmic adaptor subunit [Verrucomicrobiota bacterium]HRY49434.1 efflux RND transporter periplasmic adaptor subunit [Candidatus Paceibacterota bacterium]
MEILLLGIYSFFVWLIFFKFKWLPWNIVSQVIVVTLPIIGLTILILLLNIVAPSSHDIRVVNYVVPINPPVRGLVTDVPIEPNRPIKKGEVLFRVDPIPYQITVSNYEAQIAQLKVQLVTAEANARNLQESLKSATGQKEAIESKLRLSKLRLEQFKELAESGAGNKFDYEQAQADVQNLEGQLASTVAAEAQAREKLAAKTPEGEQDEVANVKAQITRAEAQLADARWELSQTTYYAPANGTVVALTLRPGAMAVPLPMTPAMNFIEDEQWILAIYHQNEVRKIKPGQEAEVAFQMYPGRIVKCKVDSIMWATAQGQLPIGTMNPAGGVAPVPPNCLAVRLLPNGKDKDIFLAAGAHGAGAVFTDSGHAIQILRKVLVRVSAKLDWLILKLH